MNFYIVNGVDRPCARAVTQDMGNGTLEYLSHDLLLWPAMAKTDQAANLLDFGFAISVDPEDNIATFVQVSGSNVEYSDGRTREWQGESFFKVQLKKMKGNKNV